MDAQNVYAVIDLGSSYIRGLIANKLEEGEVSPIACETLPSEGCISHGAVYNIDETAQKISKILSLLNERLEDNYEIKKLYVGIGAQSLRSEEATIHIDISEEGEEITDEHLKAIERKVTEISFPRRKNIFTLDTYYEIDGKIEAFPKSIVCHELVAHVSIITVKDWIYNNVQAVVEDRLGLQLAGVLPTPLCEAEVMLSSSQKQLGSVFVNVGGGISSVVIYYDGVFRRLRVLPFGGDNVSKDLESLRLTPEEAESIKLQYAGATTYADRDKTFEIPNFDGIGMRTMRVLDVNRYTSARMKEIAENIFEVVRVAGLDHHIKAGYLFTGGAAKIQRFDELLTNYTRHFTFNTQLSAVVDHNNALVTIPGMETAIALAYAARQNCVGAELSDLNALIHKTEKEEKAEKVENHEEIHEEIHEQKIVEHIDRRSIQQEEPSVEEEDEKTKQRPKNNKFRSAVNSLFSVFMEDDPNEDDELY